MHHWDHTTKTLSVGLTLLWEVGYSRTQKRVKRKTENMAIYFTSLAEFFKISGKLFEV